MAADRLVQLTTSAAFTWWVRHVASRLDPLLFRATNGRLTSMGPPVVPMVTITTIGRRSGRPHPVHLACVAHDGGWLVVASAMGQRRHPAWRYNLEAHPDVEVQMAGDRFRARARVLTDAEKQTAWPTMQRALPQLGVYAKRTDRNIRLFHLTRTETT
jgi:deazaflavin-dependent oxidoreductase (nitroreductase family)